MRMFTPIAALLAVVAAGTSLADDRKSDGSPTADLELVIVKRFPDVVRPGQILETGLVLRNTSPLGPHRVVRPGDGSDEGWREPHVWFEVHRKTADGAWAQAPKRKVVRCKSHKPDWREDVVEISAGGELDVRSWARDPSRYALQKPGAYRLTAHYAWRRQPVAGTDGDLGRMRDVPAFQIVSDAVPFTLERPLDVKIEVLGDVPANGASIGSVINVRGVNNTKKPLHWQPMEWKPQVEIEGGWLSKNDVVMPVDHDNPRELAPGGSSVAFAGWSARHDLKPDADAEVVRLTVALKSLRTGGGRIVSEPVEIRVAR